MIARIWDARTSGPLNTQRYQQVFETEVLAHLAGVAGFRGAYLLTREDRTNDHGAGNPSLDDPRAGDPGAMAIRTITLFDSLAAVRRFAGQDYQLERVTPEARATLLTSNPAIAHFEVLSMPGT